MTQELSEFFQQVFNAVRISGIYALVALGITVIFGLTGIVKFSIGELLTLGAFMTFAFWDNDRLSFFLAVPLAALVVGAVSVGLERGLFRHTLDQPINGFMVSLGLILVFQNVIIEFWSTDAQAVRPAFTDIWEVGDVRMPAQSWLVIAVTVVLIVVLFAGLRYTKQGRALRACAEDRDAAALMGIPVSWYVVGAFALGGALAATAGGLLASLQPITNYLGASFLLKGFAVALVGGLGSIEGAVAAALIVGFTETMAVGYASDLHLPGQEWQNAYTFGLMILILLWRPTGLFRGRGRLQETLQ